MQKKHETYNYIKVPKIVNKIKDVNIKVNYIK